MGFRFKQKNDEWKFPNKVASSSRVDLNMNIHECAVVLLRAVKTALNLLFVTRKYASILH